MNRRFPQVKMCANCRTEQHVARKKCVNCEEAFVPKKQSASTDHSGSCGDAMTGNNMKNTDKSVMAEGGVVSGSKSVNIGSDDKESLVPLRDNQLLSGASDVVIGPASFPDPKRPVLSSKQDSASASGESVRVAVRMSIKQLVAFRKKLKKLGIKTDLQLQITDSEVSNA